MQVLKLEEIVAPEFAERVADKLLEVLSNKNQLAALICAGRPLAILCHTSIVRDAIARKVLEDAGIR